jgi:hypothetical protein
MDTIDTSIHGEYISYYSNVDYAVFSLISNMCFSLIDTVMLAAKSKLQRGATS